MNSVNENKELATFHGYILYFFFFSFAGWVLEVIYSYFVSGHFVNRGFFYGPICPIYGVGGILLLTFLRNFKKNPIKLAFYSIIVFSIVEYLLGYASEALFGVLLWDYTNDFMNLNGRISLLFSLAWGVIALIFIYLVIPTLEKFTEKISSKVSIKFQTFLARLFSIIFLIDIIYSFIEYSNIHI